MLKTFLHVGCGPARKDRTTPGFNTDGWNELRLDIDPGVGPDIVSTMLDMSAVEDAAVDAVFSSHNIEHLYSHEVPVALAEFRRVLRSDGFVVITCPDLQSVCALIAEDKLTEPAYISPAGPIAPLDILYGHRQSMARGNLYMAHRCGFTQKVLNDALLAAGFASVASIRRGHPSFDLFAVATKTAASESVLRELAAAHFPDGSQLLEHAADKPDPLFFMTANSPLNTALKQAVSYHQADQLQQAEACYRTILQEHPAHPETNYNMGVLMLQMKQQDAALPYLLAALEAEPARGQYWIAYIDALHQAGQLDDARQILTLATQQGLQGEEVDALAARLTDNSGSETAQHAVQQESALSARQQGQTPDNREIDALVGLFSAGRYSEAADLARQMTERYPNHEFGWKALGAICMQAGKTAEALVPMQKAVELSAGDVEAHYNLGVILQALKRLEEAEASYRQALQISPDYADAHANLGVTLQALGRLAEAEASYRRALEIKPDYLSALGNLGVVLREQGKLELAEASFRQALLIDPLGAQMHADLGDTLQMRGQLSDAEASYRKALQIKSDHAAVYGSLGNVLKAQGRLPEAEVCYRQTLQLMPDSAEAHFNLGSIARELGRLEDAEAGYRHAIRLKPDMASAHYNLGNLLRERANFDEAEACYRQAIRLNPDIFEAHFYLGMLLKDQGRLNEAEASYRQALKIKPDLAMAHCNLGSLLEDTGRQHEAEVSCRRALQLNPDLAEAHYNLGNTLLSQGRLGEAEASYRRAIEVNPSLSEAHCNLGSVLLSAGKQSEADACFRRTLQMKPDDAATHSNLIFNLDLMAGVDMAVLSEERSRWNRAHAVHLYQQRKHLNVPDAARRLRIGYVSADFKTHSAAFAFGAMLVNYDREHFDVIAYSNSTDEDAVTREFQQNVTGWRKIFGLSDDAVADMIREDRIDILIDLSGHSSGNRLLVFARKPAPIQISAWGYAAGTGMNAMDVLFSDPVFVPPEEKHFYTEQVRYIPNAIGSFTSGAMPAVNVLPALSAKGITFGSFNRLAKSSDEVYRVWAKVLLALPDSRMIIKTQALDDAGTRARVMAHFTDADIDPMRVILQGKTTREAHLAAFNQVDIALDPFPHGGGVTALEGLMMGVPVITLRWPTLTGRVSTSIMTALGLSDWVAESPQQYVDLAVQKAGDLQSLAALRQALRGIFASSVIGDQVAYVRAVEREYRELWQQWCDRSLPRIG